MKKILLLFVITFLLGMGYAAYDNRTTKQRDKTNEEQTVKKNALVSESETKSKVNVPDVPLILQKPELDRGCEVTALAMLLQHAGVEVDKMELAEKIKKDPTPYKNENGTYYYGNPNDGFVGDIYTFDKMGYGVYHEPVAELAEYYLPDNIQDLTGKSFEDAVLKPLSTGKPVWIITNATFNKLSESEFRTWNTPSGQVKITWNEHSVVVTGYDDQYVYFNDPLGAATKAERKGFEVAWVQMGSQAITYK
ncbi:C39 family peptidase [Bacillus sp. E(2018)]|uniref:C39 family peptidase n=1 Tax=Bacillus sp. E(2018) TaxID=2502239 RepID=UPI0010FA4B2A|nr:C39 family peptidase [Bacillus sp. E(2018)]